MAFRRTNAEDEQTAERDAAECEDHVNDTCESLLIHAIPIEGALIAESTNTNKATAASLVLDGIRRRGRNENSARLELDFL